MSAISALLIDLDGTLLDTEPLHFAAHRRFLAGVGISPGEEELVGNIGKGDREFYRELMQRHGVAGDPEAWVAAKTGLLAGIYRQDGVLHRPGAQALLDHAFAEGVTCVVVTSSGRELARHALEAAGLAARLPMRVCYEDTLRHKPHPEPYLLAAVRLGIPPSSCLAIEDSASGVTAARTAGCPVVAMRGHLPERIVRAAGALRMLDSLAELVPLRDLAFAAGAAAAR